MFGRKARKTEKQPDVDLNRVVVPMLDMTFQILFFLIMNFHIPTPEGQVDLLLPSEDAGNATETESKLDTKQEYRLQLLCGGEGTALGDIASMQWGTKQAPLNPVVDVQPREMNEERDYFRSLEPKMYGLSLMLREAEPKEGEPPPNIKIECDNRLRYSELLRVMDVARKMKLTNLTVMPLPKGGK